MVDEVQRWDWVAHAVTAVSAAPIALGRLAEQLGPPALRGKAAIFARGYRLPCVVFGSVVLLWDAGRSVARFRSPKVRGAEAAEELLGLVGGIATFITVGAGAFLPKAPHRLHPIFTVVGLMAESIRLLVSDDKNERAASITHLLLIAGYGSLPALRWAMFLPPPPVETPISFPPSPFRRLVKEMGLEGRFGRADEIGGRFEKYLGHGRITDLVADVRQLDPGYLAALQRCAVDTPAGWELYRADLAAALRTGLPGAGRSFLDRFRGRLRQPAPAEWSQKWETEFNDSYERFILEKGWLHRTDLHEKSPPLRVEGLAFGRAEEADAVIAYGSMPGGGDFTQLFPLPPGVVADDLLPYRAISRAAQSWRMTEGPPPMETRVHFSVRLRRIAT